MWKEFHPTTETVLAAFALFIIGSLSLVLVFHAPEGSSRDLLLILIGALSGALSMGGARRTTTTTGDNPVVVESPPK